MNKAVIAGIIIAVAVTIGVISAVSYGVISSNESNEPDTAESELEGSNEEPGIEHHIVVLRETIAAGSSP